MEKDKHRSYIYKKEKQNKQIKVCTKSVKDLGNEEEKYSKNLINGLQIWRNGQSVYTKVMY